MSRTKREYKQRLQALREADTKHTAIMEVIAARGGKTLKEVRALYKLDKDAFIVHYSRPGDFKETEE